MTSGEENDSSDNEKNPHLCKGSLLDFLRTFMQSNVVTGPTQKILVASTHLPFDNILVHRTFWGGKNMKNQPYTKIKLLVIDNKVFFNSG